MVSRCMETLPTPTAAAPSPHTVPHDTGTVCLATYFQHRFSVVMWSGIIGDRGHAAAQLVEALRYKREGRRFDSRWCR